MTEIPKHNPQTVSRVRRYRIRAELRAIRRQSRASGVSMKTLIGRKIASAEHPEDMVPLAVIAHLSPDKIDAQIVDEISEKVSNRLMQRMMSAQADPRALAREVARLVADRIEARPALPAPAAAVPAAEAAPPPEPPKPQRISIDDIAGMIDQILKEKSRP